MKRAGRGDRRLVGTWQSDKPRTMSEIRPLLRKRSKRFRFFASVFGHLKLRFTRNSVYTDFKGDRDIESYRVLGRDAHSIAIMFKGVRRRKPRIQHIHFEGGGYWVSLGPHREWFRRIRRIRRRSSRV